MDHVAHTERGHSNNNSDDHDLVNPATDTVSVVMESIEKDLEEVPSWPSNGSIYRVPKTLRTTKPEAFRPRLVSIGPFYWGEEELKPMKAHKLRYLNNILEREPQLSLCDYVKAIAEVEDRARECYSEIIPLKSEDFVKMMLLDGCFILELILKSTGHWSEHPNDPIFNTTWMYSIIRSDLILLENQLPFFVLERLFNLSSNYRKVSSLSLIKLVHEYFGYYVRIPETTIIKSCPLQFWRRKKKESPDKGIEKGEYSLGNCEPKHLLDIIRLSLLPPGLKSSSTRSPTSLPSDGLGYIGMCANVFQSVRGCAGSLARGRRFFCLSPFSQSSWILPPSSQSSPMMKIRTAMELHEAGVKFDKGSSTSLLDIKFCNGMLKIPTIQIEDWTEPLFRNLIAYEQCLDDNSNEIATYASFMDSLINSPKDVELLQRKGIIESLLGDPKEVAAFFNGLLKETTLDPDDFYLAGVCSEVEKYYKIPRHKWKANLMHNYFNTPWALISVFAAVILLILTGVQTICSILSI